MTPSKILTISFLLTAAALGRAGADEGLTRAQVKAELAEAQRTGHVMLVGEAGLRMNELYPHLYPKAVVAGKSRETVLAELAEARRTGDVVVGESGLKLSERRPHSYPVQAQVAGKTRDEVLAELAEARAVGDVPVGGEDGRTLAQAFPERYAAVRAQRAARAQHLAARSGTPQASN